MLFKESLVFTCIKVSNYMGGGGNKQNRCVKPLQSKNVFCLFMDIMGILIFSRGRNTPLKKEDEFIQRVGIGSYMWWEKCQIYIFTFQCPTI